MQLKIKSILALNLLLLASLTTVAMAEEQKTSVDVLFILHDNTSIHWYYLEEATQDYELANTTINLTIYDPDQAAENNLTSFDIIALHHVSYSPNIQEKLDEANSTSRTVYISDTAYLWETNVPQNIGQHAYSEYWISSGVENHRNLLTYLAVTLMGAEEEIKPGIQLSQSGIFHPDYKAEFQPSNDGLFNNITAYMEWYNDSGKYHSDKPTVGLTLSGYYYANGYNLADWISIIRELEERGVNVIPILDKTDARQVFFDEVKNESRVDIVLAYMGTFHSKATFNTSSISERKAMISELGVPWINCITTSQTPEEWQNSTTGIPSSYISWAVALQEMEGLIEPIVIGGTVIDEITNTQIKVPIPGRAEYVVDRALKWTELKYLDDSQKRIALIYYSYPPGKSEIGASYMDVPQTLEVLLNEMYNAGYDLDEDFSIYNISDSNNSISSNESIVVKLITQGRNIGTWAQEDLDRLAELDAVELIPEKKYLQWFSELPEDMQQDVVDLWGEAPGDQMVYTAPNNSRYLVIPNIRYGNILLAPQPYKGYQNNEQMLYHNTSMPPNHQYIAFYLWLKKEYNASALVHVGTHGTLEWLPGKEVGLCNHSWPEVLIQDLPNPYIYIVDNVGEGTQAKRRSYSVIIDHMTPPFVPSGLYGNYSNLHQSIHLYLTSKENNNTALMDQYKNTSIRIIKDTHIDEDIRFNFSYDMSYEEFEDKVAYGEVHDYLHDMMYANIPYGLRIFATHISNESAVALVRGMLGDGYIEHIQAVNASCDYHETEEYNQAESYRLLYTVLVDGIDITLAQEEVLGSSSAEVSEDLVLAKEYYQNILLSSKSEIKGLLDSLDAKYIEPSVGGDVLRSPEVLPTGKNFYSFDPRLIPTKEAYNIGKETIDSFLVDYYEKNGEFPEKVAVVLWGIETMRNHGVPHSQMLYLIGVEPEWDANGRITYYTTPNASNLHIMNQSELTIRLSNGTVINRPRIDVIGHSSGLHRDQFPWQMDLLDDAVRIISQLDEPEDVNYVRKHSLELKEYYINLMMEGNMTVDEVEAEKLSMSRIFGPPEGDYGVRIADAVSASDTWEDTEAIAEQFIQRSGNVYINGEMYTSSLISGEDMFKAILKDTDASLFIRSSNLYGVLTGDDPFQYFGGLSLAIASVSDGARPEMWITNVRDPSNPQMQTLEEFMNLEIRTQMLNPNYIKGMMENSYSGAAKLADHLENLWGWSVVDPRFVASDDWNEVYEVYILDKYELRTNEWFDENSPWARQTMLARMLEATRKLDASGNPYWDTSDEIMSNLANEYQESVDQYGSSCYVLCCDNPLLDDYIHELVSAPETKPDSSSSSSGGEGTGSAKVVQAKTGNSNGKTGNNQTASENGGYGTDFSQPEANPADNYVEGYEMQREGTSANASSSSISFSGALIIVSLLVLLTGGAVYIGFRKK